MVNIVQLGSSLYNEEFADVANVDCLRHCYWLCNGSSFSKRAQQATHYWSELALDVGIGWCSFRLVFVTQLNTWIDTCAHPGLSGIERNN